MKKAVSLLLTLAMLLTLCTSALAADTSAVTAQTIAWPVVKGSDAAPAKTATYYHYAPSDFRFRGNSTPVIFVLGDTAWTEQSANDALTRGGFDQMAKDESGHIVFVSPSNGKSWSKDDYALMQTLATNITDDYEYVEEQQGLYDSGFAADGRMLAGRFRSYTYAEGSAQAFVKQYLDTSEATYWVAQWSNTVDGFGAGFHYADKFTREDNLKAWEGLRRTNRLSMSDGYSYVGPYSVYSDYGIDETRSTYTAPSGAAFEYLQYIPKTVDTTGNSGKYPLVMVFHGRAMNIDGYMHLMDWPVVGSEQGFITIGVNGNQTNADILALIDSLCAQYPIDTTRVYATGYSMGGMKSWSLGFEETARFAAIAPTEAIPGMGQGPVGYTAPSLKIPTFAVWGESEFFNLFPMNTPYAIELISLLSKTNSFAYSGKYEEALGKYFGMTADRAYTYDRTPATHGDAGIWTIHEMDDENGVPYTLLSSVSKLGHSAWMPSAQRIWNFFSHFSRAADGTSVYQAAPYADVAAKGWYTAAVAHALDNGLMTGKDGAFRPAAGLTADELSTALYALAGTPAAESATAWAKANALPVGGEVLTRGQIADAMHTLAKSTGANTAAAADMSAFSDGASVSDGMRWAVGAGLVTGKSGGMLGAGDAASRAEGAVMLMRLNLLLAK